MDQNNLSTRQQLLTALARQSDALDEYLSTPDDARMASKVIECNRELLAILKSIMDKPTDSEPPR
ncbi:hypothetical protein [Lacimicrobium alkaliphilum]|uniref:Uncharacterized protein n=1 Tax=Lacimicrobium alkaliphilum TaxID=1526571 RepID=A0A0U3B0U3_9ALTE|nr:hypothetical protein [Lacimicrobium alkaliphilum]ALS98904.1 hypothetical protein AT746_11890 [Lacimicrobium alkaliphilum]